MKPREALKVIEEMRLQIQTTGAVGDKLREAMLVMQAVIQELERQDILAAAKTDIAAREGNETKNKGGKP